ncbi:response regulator transcription factor [Alteribacter aurantiacus]|uniref:response regulator transcription factor n=1 Tax=Alteribacter aurantiacus TaxID=254410 RepID=UPI0003FCE0FC|nr:response regulator transcription factor [Alteribacter aurantiacus]
MRCLIAEEHELMRFGITQLLKDLFPVEYVLESVEKENIIALLKKYPFDWLLLNPTTLSNTSLAEFLSLVNDSKREVKTVILLGEEGFVDLSVLEHYPILGVIRHDEPLEDLMRAFEGMNRGRTHYSLQSSAEKGKINERTGAYLTKREEEVLLQIIQGYTVTESASVLGVTKKTIENHRHNLRKKLEVTSQQELMKEAQRLGYIQFK